MKKEKLILVGGSGSGKDYLLKKLIDKGYKSYQKITTRPKRKNELSEYDFTDNNQFESLINESKMICYQDFNIKGDIWYYGITKENFNNSEVFIMTPHELSMMSENDIKSSFIVYLNIDRKVREDRLNIRDDNNDDVKRRLDADEKDFQGFRSYDMMLTDPDFDIDDIISLWN